jgi:hypothetical protein
MRGGSRIAILSSVNRERTCLRINDQTVEGFLNQALQISPEQVSAQLEAEELGYL